ncbi:hypothetical protein [Thiomicrorhabdus heinhorstiae]|uniref:Uncharacterized protein n=1 Tax=Thiomicrorhabdus heinhorstiae TaxID=2748010 RepID=A0ABS0BX76_9GAMM|nr:hypothetical protein [Thiomicrorhabdus heinhorstiae]MBF6058393.1 hypothetical protein [Thiomicrorhabdus heinhorstiae]
MTPRKSLSSSKPILCQPLCKTFLYGFAWSLIFAAFIPLGKIAAWQYSILLGSVPSTLLWDLFNLQNTTTQIASAIVNATILFTPYFYFRLSGEQSKWLWLTFSLYGFINAALGFSIIISLRGGHL